MLTVPAVDNVKVGARTVRAILVVALKEPEVPVTVSVVAPAVAVLLAVSVRTLVPDVGFVLHAAVTPLGSPDTARVTLPVNPYSGVTVIVEVPELPWFTPTLLGDADRVKVGVWMARVRVVVAVRLPEVPVIVTAVFPDAAVLLAVRVSTLVLDVGFVPHDAVTPLGRVEVTARVTFPVNPPASDTVIVVVFDEP